MEGIERNGERCVFLVLLCLFLCDEVVDTCYDFVGMVCAIQLVWSLRRLGAWQSCCWERELLVQYCIQPGRNYSLLVHLQGVSNYPSTNQALHTLGSSLYNRSFHPQNLRRLCRTRERIHRGKFSSSTSYNSPNSPSSPPPAQIPPHLPLLIPRSILLKPFTQESSYLLNNLHRPLYFSRNPTREILGRRNFTS